MDESAVIMKDFFKVLSSEWNWESQIIQLTPNDGQDLQFVKAISMNHVDFVRYPSLHIKTVLYNGRFEVVRKQSLLALINTEQINERVIDFKNLFVPIGAGLKISITNENPAVHILFKIGLSYRIY